jgi:hypothetical protein
VVDFMDLIERFVSGSDPKPGGGPYAAAMVLLVASVTIPLGTGAPWYVFFPLALTALLCVAWGVNRPRVATVFRENRFLHAQVSIGGGWRKYYRKAVFIRDYMLEYVILASPNANSGVPPKRLLEVVNEGLKRHGCRLLLLRENEVFVRFALRMLCMCWARRGVRKGWRHLSKRIFPVVVPMHAHSIVEAVSLKTQVKSQLLELVSGHQEHPLIRNFEDYVQEGRFLLLIDIQDAPQPILDEIAKSFSKCPIVCVMSRDRYVPDLPGPFSPERHEVKVLKRLARQQVEQLLRERLRKRGDGKRVFDYACKHSLVDQLGDPGFLVQMIESRKRKRSTSLDLFMQEQRLELKQLVETAADRATTPEEANTWRRSLARIATCMRTSGRHFLKESSLLNSGLTPTDIQRGVESGYLKRRQPGRPIEFSQRKYEEAFAVEAVLEESRGGSLCKLAREAGCWWEIIARASVLSGEVIHQLLACKDLQIYALAMACDAGSPASWSETVGSEIGQALESDEISWRMLEEVVPTLRPLMAKAWVDISRIESQIKAIRIRSEEARGNVIRFFSLLGRHGFRPALESSLESAGIEHGIRLLVARGLFQGMGPSTDSSTSQGPSAYGFVSSRGFSVPAMVALGSEASARARSAPRKAAVSFLEEVSDILRSFCTECGDSLEICSNLAQEFFATDPEVDWRLATPVKDLLLEIWHEGASADAHRLVAQPLIKAYAKEKKAQGRLQRARLGVIQHFGGARAVSAALESRGQEGD